MKRYVMLIIILWVGLLGGCNGEATPTPVAQVAVTATDKPIATNTVHPTNTAVPTSTHTVVPTNTATAVPSDTPTATATATTTDTPEPTVTATSSPTSLPPTAVPATSLPPTAPPAPPPAAPAPSGPNLLVNPGFEGESNGWFSSASGGQFLFYTVDGFPQFVHAGGKAAFFTNPGKHYAQKISGATPGTTYRAGVWVKIWSSTGDDRNVSENPGDVVARVCINTTGDYAPTHSDTLCSGFVRPLDVWQYISIDGVAKTDQVAIILSTAWSGSYRPKHNEIIFDDAALGTGPVAATVTPPPAPPPIRPQAIPFDAVALRDSMTQARSVLEQMGGLLDRIYNGERATCAEFQGYYGDLIRTPTYHSLPPEWQNIYNDYIFAVENGIATNEGVNSLCEHGGGNLDNQAYGVARQGINTSLERLIPAIEAANALLGQ